MFGGCGIHGLREKKVQIEVFTEMRYDENMNAIIYGVNVRVKIGNLGSWALVDANENYKWEKERG